VTVVGGTKGCYPEPTTVAPPSIPSYASACTGAHYFSACSCIGVTGVTTTALAPSTTVTVTAEVTSTAIAYDGPTIPVTFYSGQCTTVSEQVTFEIGPCYPVVGLSGGFGTLSLGSCPSGSCIIYAYSDSCCASVIGALPISQLEGGCEGFTPGDNILGLELICTGC
jgi:hypothetical protein